jgi:hypothetical protein
MGKMFEVEVVECGKFFMKGKILNQDKVLSSIIEKPIISRKIGKLQAYSNGNTCCDDSCGSCDTEELVLETKSNKIFNKLAYGALVALSVAFLSRITWKNFIQNK